MNADFKKEELKIRNILLFIMLLHSAHDIIHEGIQKAKVKVLLIRICMN